MRIEDIDAARTRPGASEAAIADLTWLGFDWDDGPFVQSQRIRAYEDGLELLKRKELVYPCTCTRADIERAASAPHAEDEGPTYPGTCSFRSTNDAEQLGDRPFAWRFRVPEGAVGWDDLFLGRIEIDPRQVGGDFIVARSPFVPSYQLAVVLDDTTMGITQVVRGADLIPSTPRQIVLNQALGGVERVYGHVPLVIGTDGKRLAKRDGSIKLAALRVQGVDPRQLIGWLARSCGWSREIIASTPIDWIDRYDGSAIPTEPCVYDDSK